MSSTSMAATVDTRKTEPCRLHAVQLRTSGALNLNARTTSQHFHTGFIVVDRQEEFLSWAEHVETAVQRSREIDHAFAVLRCSDGAVIARRPRAYKGTRT